MSDTKIILTQDIDVRMILSCYDDANLLFDEQYRADGTIDIIRQVMQENDTYHYALDGEIAGWISFRQIDEMSILSAIYVKRKYQGKHVAKELMNFYFNKIDKNRVKFSVLSYLSNALWAEKFYRKAGYRNLLEVGSVNSQQVLKYADENQNSFSCVMIKELN